MAGQPFSGGVDALAADQAFDLYADRGKGDQVDDPQQAQEESGG